MERIVYFNGMWYITRRYGTRKGTTLLTVGIRQSGTTASKGFTYRSYDITGR